MLCYLATGIACATYAAAWGEPPEYCEQIEDLSDQLSCDYEALTATNALETVSFQSSDNGDICNCMHFNFAAC